MYKLTRSMKYLCSPTELTFFNVYNVSLQATVCVKYLGVLVDSWLDWCSHIHFIKTNFFILVTCCKNKQICSYWSFEIIILWFRSLPLTTLLYFMRYSQQLCSANIVSVTKIYISDNDLYQIEMACNSFVQEHKKIET